MAVLVFKPDIIAADEKPNLLVNDAGKVLSAKNIREAVVAESCYVGYAVWDPGLVEHRIDDEACYREVVGETFASCECGGASFEFDSLNPRFSRVKLEFDDGKGFPRRRSISNSVKGAGVTGTDSGHPDSVLPVKPIKWYNDTSNGEEMVGYGESVKVLYDKAIEDLVSTMPNGGALTPPKKFCLTTEGIADGGVVWFNMDGWGPTKQIELNVAGPTIAGAFAGIGAEIWKCNNEILEDVDTTEYEYGCIFYGYTAFSGQKVGDWIDTDHTAAFNTTRWGIMSFPTVRAGTKVSFCVSTELKVYSKSNTRVEETESAKTITDVSCDSYDRVATTVTTKNSTTTQPLSALEGVPLMVYNLKEFKNEIEEGKETVWEFDSYGSPVEGYVVPKAEWCCSTSAWEYVQGGGESKITITVPDSRTVMLGVESGGLWGQVTNFVRGAQASVCEEKYWRCTEDGSFDEGHKKKEEHISGGAYVWQTVALVGNAKISFG